MPQFTTYTAQTSGGMDVADLIPTVDVSDTSQGLTGTFKKERLDDFAAGIAPLLTGSDPWTALGNVTGTATITGNSTTGGGWTALGTIGSTQTLTG